eukprot:1886517-Prymnesium_polylepis.1
MGRLRGAGTATWLWRVRRRIHPVTKWRLRWTPHVEPYQSPIARRARAFAGSWADGRVLGTGASRTKGRKFAADDPPG